MQKPALTLVGMGLAFVVAVLGLNFLTAPDGLPPWQFYTALGLSLMIAIGLTGSGVLFSLSFGSFRGSKYYGRIIVASALSAISLMLFGASFLQIPWQMLQGVDEKSYAAAINLLFTIGILIIYFSNRSLTGMFGIKSAWHRPWVLLAATAGLTALLSLTSFNHLPRSFHLSWETFYTAFSIVLMALTAHVIWRIKSVIGIAYVRRFAWVLLAAVVHIGSVGIANTAVVLALGYQPVWALLWVVLAPMAISVLFMIRSAYIASSLAVFADTEERAVARNFFGEPRRPNPHHAPTSLDIVMFTANLVSNPRAIDDTLNKVRAVTAHLQSGQVPTPEEDGVLKTSYLEIEQYLAEKERLRSFTRDRLRRLIAQKLQISDASSTFWSSLN